MILRLKYVFAKQCDHFWNTNYILPSSQPHLTFNIISLSSGWRMKVSKITLTSLLTFLNPYLAPLSFDYFCKWIMLPFARSILDILPSLFRLVFVHILIPSVTILYISVKPQLRKPFQNVSLSYPSVKDATDPFTAWRLEFIFSFFWYTFLSS